MFLKSSSFLTHGARGLLIIAHFMFRYSSNQNTIVSQKCTSCNPKFNLRCTLIHASTVRMHKTYVLSYKKAKTNQFVLTTRLCVVTQADRLICAFVWHWFVMEGLKYVMPFSLLFQNEPKCRYVYWCQLLDDLIIR